MFKLYEQVREVVNSILHRNLQMSTTTKLEEQRAHEIRYVTKLVSSSVILQQDIRYAVTRILDHISTCQNMQSYMTVTVLLHNKESQSHWHNRLTSKLIKSNSNYNRGKGFRFNIYTNMITNNVNL